jgi:chloramphenicol 3-O phosphotransferase
VVGLYLVSLLFREADTYRGIVRAGRVIVLNGTSSAGKTTLARALQDRLADGGEWWLLLGIDTLITAMPWRMFGHADGHTIHDDGSIDIGRGWRTAHDQWREAVGALARAGANVILDEVFLDATGDQRRWRQALDGLDVTWVGVHCDVEIAAAREAARPDHRAPNLARHQATIVHEGVEYDVIVDTTAREPDDAADDLRAQLPRQR